MKVDFDPSIPDAWPNKRFGAPLLDRDQWEVMSRDSDLCFSLMQHAAQDIGRTMALLIGPETDPREVDRLAKEIALKVARITINTFYAVHEHMMELTRAEQLAERLDGEGVATASGGMEAWNMTTQALDALMREGKEGKA